MVTLKSAREIETMRRSGKITAKVLTDLMKAARPGVTTKYLDEMAERGIRELGGIPTFMGYHDYPASICASVNDEVVHGIPGDYLLKEGDLLSIDIGTTFEGYVSDSAVTVPIGAISQAAQQLLDVTQECLMVGIAQMERGNFEPLLQLSSEQLDEVGNTEMLPWYFLFGAFSAMGGSFPGELLTYQPTWHHGHAVMRFIPNRREGPATSEIPPAYTFTQGGFEFYKAPKSSSYQLNKVLFDLRHDQNLRFELLKDSTTVAAKYKLSPTETTALATITDENIDSLRSLKPHPLVDAGAHPLGMLMCLVVVQAEARRMRAAAQQ